MIDYLRGLTRPAEEKRRDRLNAYIDGALSDRERRRFEKELAGDPRLQAELKEIEAVRAALRRLPRVRPPRNFTLDPAAYGVPRPYRAGQWYPVLRTATAFAALAFVFLLALNLFLTPGGAPSALSEISNDAAREAAAEADLAAPATMEEEVIAEGEIIEQTAPPQAMEAPAEAAPTEAAPAEAAAAAPGVEEPTAAADEAPAEEAAPEEAVEEEAPSAEATQATRIEAPAPPEAAGAIEATTTDALESSAYPEPPIPQSATPAEYPPPATQPAEVIAVQPTSTLSPEMPAQSAEADAAPKDEAAPFPILLLAQIITGVVFVGLFVVLLLVRRRL